MDAKADNRAQRSESASGIDAALELMSRPSTPPEGTVMTKAQFEQYRLPILKGDKPGLKASQYRDIIKKEWQRSVYNKANAPS